MKSHPDVGIPTNEDFRNAVTEIWGNIKDAFVGAWEGIKAAWDVAAGFFKEIWASIKTTFAPVAEYLSERFETAWNSVEQIFSGAIDFIAGVFTGDWERAWDGIKGIFTGVWNGIVGNLEGAVNLVIKGINWLISQLNKISFTLPDWVPAIGGKSFGFNIPSISEVQIPRLAAGAVIPPNREFMAVLGDQPRGNNIEAPEALIRKIVREENGNSQIVALLEELIAVERAGRVLNLNGRELGRATIKEINDATARAGRTLLKV